MPARAPYTCSAPGCAGTVPCPDHPPRKAWAGRGDGRVRGYGAGWATLAARVVREEPVCRACGDEPSVAADHIKPRSQGGTDDRANLQGIGQRCHARKTAAEAQAGRRRRAQGAA